MGHDPVGQEDYNTPAPTEDRVEITGGVLLVRRYGCHHLPVDLENGNFTGLTQELKLERVALVSNQGRYILLSMKWLRQSFDAPMRFYPDAAVICPQNEDKSLILRLFRP